MNKLEIILSKDIDDFTENAAQKFGLTQLR